MHTYPEPDTNIDLSAEDNMAFGFLSRAAQAIRLVPTLIAKLDAMSADMEWVRGERDTLRERCEMQATDLDQARAQIASLQTSEADTFRKYQTGLDTIADRQRDIDLLDATIADLRAEITSLISDRDGWQAKSALQAEALDTLVGQINAIHEVLGKPALDPDPREEIEAACAPSPSDDPPPPLTPDDADNIGDGLDDPGYRRASGPDPIYHEGTEGVPSSAFAG